MEKFNSDRKFWRIILYSSFALLVFLCAAFGYWLVDYNNRVNVVTKDTENSSVYLELDTNNPKGERWESLLQLSDSPYKAEMFTGETINCTIRNDNRFNVGEWAFKITTGNECYLNGFWGGNLEIHQFREDKEIVETLKGIVNSSEISQLEVNPYINAMMIRLMPGDYIIFAPNPDAGVSYISHNDCIGIVFNFYYQTPLDFSEYQITYRNRMKLQDLWEYKILLCLWCLWILGMIIYHTILFTNNRFIHDMRNTDQNISVMADLYLETHIINADRNTSHLISGNQQEQKIKIEKGNTQDCLYSYADEDCFEVYQEDLKAFLNLSTLEQRMKEVSSIVFEYKSKSSGWCSLRIFKLSKNKEGSQYVLALQDINEERHKLHEYEEHIKQTENVTLLQGTFLDTVFYALNGMVVAIRSDMKSLEDTMSDDSQKLLANNVGYNIEHLLLLGSFVHDLFTIEAERFQLLPVTYNIHEMVKMIEGMIHPFVDKNPAILQLDVDKSIPRALKGDKKRFMQILTVLLSSSMLMTREGCVKLSIFGKQNGDVEELLFSVRDNTDGFTDEQLNEINELISNSKRKYMGNAAYVYFYIINRILQEMNSQLKIVSVPGSGSEFYFSVEQEIVNE